MLDTECLLVEEFHWTLGEIYATDIEALIPFLMRLPSWRNRRKSPAVRRVYADQAGWL